MTEYQPRVIRSKKGAAQAWGVSSELRPEWSERGFIVQHTTEVLLPARDQSVAVVRNYTQAWKVCRLKGRMQTVGQGKSMLSVGRVSDLRVSGERWYRIKAFFVARAAENFVWEKSKRGVAFGTLVMSFNRTRGSECSAVWWRLSGLGLDCLISLVLLLWRRFQGVCARWRCERGRSLARRVHKAAAVKKEGAPSEPQGADLLRAAGLGAVMPRRSKPLRVKDGSGYATPVVKGEDGKENGADVVGDLLGRNRAVFGWDGQRHTAANRQESRPARQIQQ
jgi:hypothetical protein